MPIGYEFLRDTAAPKAFAVRRPARVRPVARVTPMDEMLAIPASVAPAGESLLEHILFALKHEGTNLQILAKALPLVSAAEIADAVKLAPTGQYIRVACYLWEHFCKASLEDASAPSNAPTAHVFDAAQYITVAAERDKKWHVTFNGLGTLNYCATVRRTPEIEAAISRDVLAQTASFIETLDKGMTDRALAWAYLHETENSFAIEREAPSEAKSMAFVDLLRQAHAGREMSEAYMVELQNAVITNPWEKAVQYRTEQNWLKGPGRGAMSITYLPPPPLLMIELMGELERLDNRLAQQIDPIVAAAICSFGFVYNHPFMDGNGRLSRFLFHHALCRSGKLANGLLLPVSVAMKRHEADYLACLQEFSKPARAMWNVTWAGDGNFGFEFIGDEANYRYWDATSCVAFSLRMAQEALDIELRKEAEFLAHYDEIYRAVNSRFDVRSNDLSTLIMCAMDNAGTVSKNRRKQYQQRVPDEFFDALEQVAKAVLGGSSARS